MTPPTSTATAGSEQIVGRFIAATPNAGFTVATKMGRRMAQLPANYVIDNFRAWVRSGRNLGTDRPTGAMHCPPSEVIDADATYDALDTLVDEGSIAAYGVSVETAAQALAAIAHPHVASIQIILNAFRHKPLDDVLPGAEQAGVRASSRGYRWPRGCCRASTTRRPRSLPTTTAVTTATAGAFDIGETFSGVDYETGLVAAQEFADLVGTAGPDGITPAQAAIAGCWQQPGCTTVIPGAQARAGEVQRRRRQGAAVGGGVPGRCAPHL